VSRRSEQKEKKRERVEGVSRGVSRRSEQKEKKRERGEVVSRRSEQKE
jgi:hypothetical protein